MIFRLLWGLFGWRKAPRREHEAQLRAMSDGELADLGIGRSQIPAVLGDEAWIAAQGRDDKSAVMPCLTRHPRLTSP